MNYANNSDPTKHFKYRDWEIGEILEKRSGEKAADPKAGHRFQTRLAIVIDGLATGTLVVGFHRRPNDQVLHRAPEILREWARESNPKSTQQRGALIDFLEHLSLMGRVLDVRIGQDDLG